MEIICLLIWILARSVEIVRVVVSFLHKRNDGYLICGLKITPFGNIHPDCVVAAGGVGVSISQPQKNAIYKKTNKTTDDIIILLLVVLINPHSIDQSSYI